MNILGIGDWSEAGAALVVDDTLVSVDYEAWHQNHDDPRGLPWESMQQVLNMAGKERRDVDIVVFGGRFSPPLLLRKHPGLRHLAQGPFFLNTWSLRLSLVVGSLS